MQSSVCAAEVRVVSGGLQACGHVNAEQRLRGGGEGGKRRFAGMRACKCKAASARQRVRVVSGGLQACGHVNAKQRLRGRG
eukprot:360056-Chlamydomonas_euryale.AAC.17